VVLADGGRTSGDRNVEKKSEVGSLKSEVGSQKREVLSTVGALVCLLLILDGLLAGLWVAARLPTLGVHGPVTIAFILARGFAAAALLAGGWLLLQRRPPGTPIARAALVAAASLYTVDVAFRLSPTNLDPTFRWVPVVAYWVYATVVRGYLGKTATS